MDLWDSIVRVLWDPDGERLVLVPYGMAMWRAVEVDGQQDVQTSSYVRGTGTKNFPRANEAHKITFTVAREKSTIEVAFDARLNNARLLPRTTKDVLLSFAGTPRQYRVKNCAIESWPHDQEEHVTRESVVILGGEIVLDSGTYADGDVWGEVPALALLGEDGEPILAEDGSYILTE